MSQNTTIAAIATAMSPAGISIIRISGEKAFDIIDKIYRGKNPDKKLSEQPSHTIHYGYIYENEQPLDEVMVLLMRAPRSYTAEDTVEIDCHGGTYVTQRILETVIRAGAVPAEPGEFTKRAFLNGRIDLSRAEAVIDVINAKNKFALNSSVRQLRGSISEQIRRLRNILLDDISYLEAGMDDPEHISLDGCSCVIEAHLKHISEELIRMKKNAEGGKILSEGVHTVILGKPNVGKSSLMNFLSGNDRAIVTDIEGTTRDILEEHIRIGGIELILTDTAGIRETGNVIEKIGVEKAITASKQADLVLFVVDASAPLDENDRAIFSMIQEKRTIILLNKSDLVQVISENDIIKELSEEVPIISVSAKEEAGMEALEGAIAGLFSAGELSWNDEVFVTNVRHLYEIDKAAESIGMVENAIQEGLPEDFYTIDLMNAYTHLGNVIGESVEEDLVERIFEKFCMGK